MLTLQLGGSEERAAYHIAVLRRCDVDHPRKLGALPREVGGVECVQS